MFIDTIPNRKSPPAVLLRESYREGGRVKKRTLANLSKLPQSLIDGIEALLDGGKVSGKREAEPSFEIVRSLPHGHVTAVQAMIRKLGLERMLQGRTGVDKRVRNLIEAMIIQRIIAPGSKLAFHRALAPETATSSLALSVGLVDVAEREVYAALDWLMAQQTRIEAALAKRHLADGTLVLYDVSSSYMEGRCCALATRGYSRDHRPDRPQIVYGLLCAPDGTPVAVEVFEGNTSDPQTIREQIDKLKRRFKLSHVALVGDRGMITQARLTEDIKPDGLDWITALRAPAIKELVKGGALQLSLFDQRDMASITSPDFPGERLIPGSSPGTCRNPDLAAERTRKRQDLLAATERDLARIQAAVRRKRNPLRGTAEIGIAVGAVIDNHKMRKHFDIEITDARFTFTRKADAIAAEAATDGIYIVRTSLTPEVLDDATTVRTYKSLSQVERAFRCIKHAPGRLTRGTVDLHVRPVHHWLADRVRAHVFLCMLAYYLEWHMRRALAPLLFDATDREAAEAARASVVAKAQRSPAAIRKQTTGITPDGPPVHSFRTLLADLATLACSTIVVAITPRHPLTVFTRPTPIQRKAFELLEVAL